jgi:chromosome segregation protein
MFRLEKLEINGFKSFADRTSLVFGEGITGVVGPNGCGKCLSGDSLVTLADGREIPIREMVEAALVDASQVENLDDGLLIRSNPHDIKILSLNPQTLRLEPRPVTAFIKREATAYLLRVRTRSGREVMATPYHPLFTLDNGQLRTLKAEELKAGVRLALPRRLPVSQGEVDLSPLAVLDSFRNDDGVFIPNSDSLRAWAESSRAEFGTWSDWVRAADVPATRLKGLLNNQAVNASALQKLAGVAALPPPLDGRLKSHGDGVISIPSTFTPELARFLGLLIAEGRNTSSNQVWFVNSDQAVNDDYERLAQELFGVRVRRLRYKKNAEDGLIFSHALCVALERLFDFPINSCSADKEIPAQLFGADASTQWSFLSGLFEGDAYISVKSKNGNSRPPFIEYTTASLKLARQVVSLLLRLGIFATLRPREKYASNTLEKRRRTYYVVLIYGAEQLRHTARHLSFVGEKQRQLEALLQLPSAANPNHDLIPCITPIVKEAARKAGVKIKPNRRNHSKLAAYCENRCEASRNGLLEVISQIEQLGDTPELAQQHLQHLSILATSDIYWDEIVSIEEVEPSDPWVYDLSIADTHNFVAENIVVHNSNVAEAISWVLGEQSAKNLRGGKMEDVIFNGTRDRKPTGMAEVVLTLVAIEDIAGRETQETVKEDGSEYDEVVEVAERAAYAARALVEETLAADAPAPEQSGDAGGQAAIPPPENDIAALTPSSETGPAEAVASQPQTARLEITIESADSSDQKRPAFADRARGMRRRKRRQIAISAGERITVGRRLYRTGDSEYLMNGRPCLLRDIQDLFAGTGLGGAHYAIIEQGRIGQILSSKPLDRRALIEEAAGITRFKSRKRAVELRLESAKQNLMRLNDIISEVERQVNSLKRQAQKARRFRRLREEMRGLQRTVFTADYHRLTESAERIALELERAEARQAETDLLVSEREAEHKAVSTRSRDAEDHLAGLRERAAALELETDRVRNRRSFDEQQIREIAARIQEIERDQQDLEARLSVLDDEADRRASDLRSLESELSTEQSDLLEREALYQAETARLRDAEGGIEQLRQRMLAEIGVTERLRNLHVSLEDALRRVRLKQSNLEAEMQRAATRLDEASNEYARVGGEVEGNRAKLVDLTQSIAEHASALDALRGEVALSRSQLEAAHTERAAAEHRLASLVDLDAHHAYYSDAVQHVLSPEQAARINALGTLADFVEVEAQYERLIESLFGRELQCVLVPTIDDALAGVESLKAEGLGRGAFLVVGLHGGEGEPSDDGRTLESDDNEGGKDRSESGPSGEEDSQPEDVSPAGNYFARDTHIPTGFIAEPFYPVHDPSIDDRRQESAQRFTLDILRAIDLLGLRPEIKSVVERAFPDKCAAALVPDIEAALQLSIENASRVYVTPDGEQVVNGRLIVTGVHAAQKGTSLLALKREIKQLRAHTIRLGEQERHIAGQLASTQSRLEETEGRASSLDQQLRQREKEAAAGDSQMEGLARDLERAAQHVRVVEAESEQTREERAEIESRIERLAADLEAAETSQREVQSSLAAAQSAFQEMRARAEQSAEHLSSARASVAARAERLQAARSETRRISGEAEELRARINRNRLELYESHNRTEQLVASQTEGETATARFESERASLAEQIEEAARSLAEARGRTDELEAMLSRLRQESSSAHDLRSQIEVERARIESEAEHLSRNCFSELAQPLEEVVASVELGRAAAAILGEVQTAAAEGEPGEESPAVDDVEAARARLDELRLKLDEMGAVNMMALEELEEAEERFRFLSEQRRDILDSIKTTEEALSEIKRRSRERFRHAFTHINQNFERMFIELFGGGRGEMILIDEDDVLESGIDLIAQPPGKRLQNVLLLSGGEKAMAAIALVLAIFEYRPSPFCILDEVDAPLDEVNVGRFSGKIIEMSNETQFLVITHNKRTMEAARALYGVTMEEPGISKLVSVKFD